jgi:hypothetical protein
MQNAELENKSLIHIAREVCKRCQSIVQTIAQTEAVNYTIKI